MRSSRAGFWLALGVALFGSSGCRCASDHVLARLTESHGTVHRDWAKHPEQWQRAEPGAVFDMGDGVRSGKDSGAVIELDGGGTLTLGPESVIRFLPNAESDALALDVEVGEAVLETGREALRISSGIGAVVIDPMTRVALQRSGRGLRFEVAVGRISVENSAGQATQVLAGSGIDVGLGGVVLGRSRRRALGAGSASAAAPGSATAPGSAGPIVARASGSGVTQLPPASEWRPLSPGESSIVPGTGLRVSQGSSVELQRGAEVARLGPGEFVVGVPGGAFVQAVRGPVRLSGAGASLRVPGGLIVARDADTSADVDLSGEKGTSIVVNLGRVEVRAADSTELRGGESALLGPSGGLEIRGRGPEPAQLVVDAGDSFTVHDPRPPALIGFRPLGRCPKGAVITLGQRRHAQGQDTINLSLGPGRHAYELRCLSRDGPGDSVASGVVTVLNDAGTRTLPRSAPATHVNTDGRRYTVLYQNLLPKISVGWATAPPASAYTLVVQGALSRTINTGAASYSFPAGALPEGTHTMYFEAATTPARRSRPTTVAIVYDNATPTASIDGPVELEPGRAVVSGTTMPGWTVSIGEHEVAVDGNRRFRTDVEVPSDGAALPITFRHPTRGVHYYLRRSK